MPSKKTVFEARDPTQVEMLGSDTGRCLNVPFSLLGAIICPKQIDAGSTRETELRSELTRCIQKLAAKGFVDSDG